jgi:ATP-dependent exoDNAse (exonuclease V) beta subunit
LLQRPDGRPGAKPDSILCITYTRAAASEMLTRPEIQKAYLGVDLPD